MEYGIKNRGDTSFKACRKGIGISGRQGAAF
jgi:hypothetical protein